MMRSTSVLGQMIARVADDDDYRRWAGQVERAGYCVRPIRLSGTATTIHQGTGEVAARYDSSDEPGGVLLVACKDRRESVCPPCAARYRADAWHVFAAGVRAGRDDAAHESADESADGLDHGDEPGGNPIVLATFTAPSFGKVHAFRDGGICRAVRGGQGGERGKRGKGMCEHGRPLGCPARHDGADALVGAPLCVDCADLAGQVLWNAHVGELWRRTVIYVYRALAALAPALGGQPVGVRQIRELLRVSYVKVAEFQRRGVVHLHVLARLDGVNPDDPDAVLPAPAWAGVELLTAALRQAAGRVNVALPVVDARTAAVARWGRQLDVRLVAARDVDAARVAGYLAKYATKTVSDSVSGLPASRPAAGDGGDDGSGGRLAGHVAALTATVRKLARLATCRTLRLARHVHTLGFRGHVTSKSRRYSTTFTALRERRRAWRRAQAGQDRGHDPWAHDGGGAMVVVGDWKIAGIGYHTFGDRVLADVLGREHRQARQAMRLGLTE
ncbi:replication initiator [Nonomuraea harbinensis]|uniref:Replication initiator n=1 Tax=Nonomuraea harbinensis TaxID=1286938 RepID=A0ABW1BUG3_9ACTN|nr:replication initiator [Nonomuraea harbinensis]